MKTIEERLETLERSNRRYRRLLAGLGIFAVVALLAAGSTTKIPNVIQARSFQVVNDAGKTVVSINYLPSGACPWGDEGGGIYLYKNDGQIALLASAHSGGGKIVCYKNEKAALFLAHPGQDSGGLAAVFDKQGEVIWSAPSGLTQATLKSQLREGKSPQTKTQKFLFENFFPTYGLSGRKKEQILAEAKSVQAKTQKFSPKISLENFIPTYGLSQRKKEQILAEAKSAQTKTQAIPPKTQQTPATLTPFNSEQTQAALANAPKTAEPKAEARKKVVESFRALAKEKSPSEIMALIKSRRALYESNKNILNKEILIVLETAHFKSSVNNGTYPPNETYWFIDYQKLHDGSVQIISK